MSNLNRVLLLYGFGLLMCLATSTSAQLVDNNYIYLKGQRLSAVNNIDDWLEHDQPKVKFPTQLLLQFQRIPSEEEKNVLHNAGVVLQDYVPERAYTAIVYHPVTKELFELNNIKFVTLVQENWKCASDVLQLVQTNTKQIELNISLVEASTTQEREDLLKAINGKLLEDRVNALGYVVVSTPKQHLSKILQSHIVKYVGLHQEEVTLNYDVKGIAGMRSAVAPMSTGGRALSGKDVAMGIGDNYSGIDHIDLQDRVINYVSRPYNYHGLHISGIAGGAGIVDERGEGAAPDALLSTHFFSDVLNATPSIFKLHNVTVTNNSYSARLGNCDYTGTYDNLSIGVDALSRDYPDVLHVFAAANNGRFECAPYPKGFGTVAGGYQASKNALVVTSTNKEFVNAESGSRGPLLDGRLKPEITTVGVSVYSTTNTEEYLYSLGTSMASPNVAGAAALLTERYKQLKSNANPQADLLKALLINGTTDIGTKGPDYRFGFGFLNLEHSLTMLDSNRYFEKASTQGTVATETIAVPAGLKRLKVLLYWHDRPASSMSAKQLVNDLDLYVQTPTNNTHKPLVLNTNPNNILDEAKEGEDHLNNCEQVTIENPVAGNYVLAVKGNLLTTASQRYVLAYDFEEDKLELKYPRVGAQVLAGDTLFVYWDGYNDGNTYKLEFSINNGGLWTDIDNNIAADKNYYAWEVPENISSGRCLVRVSKNNTALTNTTGLFAITPRPDVNLSAVQCPGYMQIEWPPISNATGYQILLKQGDKMEVVDTTASLGYTFNGLQTTETYYAAIRPIVDGLSGFRSLAVKRIPSDGDCAGSISDFDLKMDAIESPVSGRLQTSTALTNNENLSVYIYNLDDAACNSYKLSYRINGGVWTSQAFTDAINARSRKLVTMSGLDLSAVGDYTIDIAIENTSNTDPVAENDSTTIYVSQIANPALTLDVVSAFEGVAPFNISKDSVGIGINRRWDYTPFSKDGRIRNYVLDDILIGGNRSISMDAVRNSSGVRNSFTGTFNLSNYNATSDEIRLEFDYIIHGVPKHKNISNNVTVRGTDTKVYQSLYSYNTELEYIGSVVNSGSLSLSDLVLAGGDNFSSSTQIQFNQNDTSVIANKNFGNGLTIDNVRIYSVQNDIQLLSINSPASFSCGVTGPLPLSITIRNGVAQTLNNVQLNYRLDDGAVVSETLTSINGKQTLAYTFSQNLDITQSGSHLLDVWLVANGDTYSKNDSINNYLLRNQPLITSYPYFEDFEGGDGFWYTDGIKPSWEYGQPVGQKISTAGSGTKAWVTNLDGNYNDYETSYLYSPCFNIASLENPTLSFKMAQDIENCGATLCDGAYMQYSTNGIDWQLLGQYREGENWYTDSNFMVWNLQDVTDWRQAKMSLPDSVSDIQLRFVLSTDPGATFEGLGVDDIRIYNERIYKGTDDVISISPNPTTDGNVCIEWAANSGKQMQVAITDMAGRIVI